MKRKQGISLIVLVITIIVMIILAAAVVLTLSNTGIINKADEAVKNTDIKQVEYIASLAWSEAYADGKRGDTLKNDVLAKLEDYTNKYEIEVTDKGVTVTDKNGGSGNETTNPDPNPTPDPDPEPDTTITLGSLITSAADYGKTINYVSDNGVTDWRILYKQTVNEQEYVYLVETDPLEASKVPITHSEASVTATEITLQDGTKREAGRLCWPYNNVEAFESLYKPVQNADMWMFTFTNLQTKLSGVSVSYLLDETNWVGLTNTTKYKRADGSSYVFGAIGSFTAEMFIASWNAKRELAIAAGDTTTYGVELKLTTRGYGYNINGGDGLKNMNMTDTLYSSVGRYVWFATPSNFGSGWSLLHVSDGDSIGSAGFGNPIFIRPVVCLSADIPASIGTSGTTDYVI